MDSNVVQALQLIRNYGLDRDPQTATWAFMLEHGILSDGLAKGLLPQLMAKARHAIAHPNVLPQPPDADEFLANGAPDIRIGHLAENPQVPVGLKLVGRVPHLLAAGMTGGGKSTLFRVMIDRIEAMNATRPTTSHLADHLR